jgi:hypothetical protein
MNRSARSTKQNITEGWKRNSTKEYYEFLGYAIASNAELEEDATDICKGYYKELMGIKGVMGERGLMGEKGLTGIMGELETIPFYPLDPLLPSVVQLKLRAKELNFLLTKLQQSLSEKMASENTLPTTERIRIRDDQEKDFDHWIDEQRKKIK